MSQSKVAFALNSGLDNVGNTCFMNSVLQALANTVEVRDYFVGKYLRFLCVLSIVCISDDVMFPGKHFKKDINLENPLGMKGRMAEEFSAVVGKLWSSKTHSFAPSKFRVRSLSMYCISDNNCLLKRKLILNEESECEMCLLE